MASQPGGQCGRQWDLALSSLVWLSEQLCANATESNNITYYILMYIAKKQGKSYNASALLAKGLLYHFNDEDAYIMDIRERSRLLLFRSLMGWGDVYRSHHYVPVYWPSFVAALFLRLPSEELAAVSYGMTAIQATGVRHLSILKALTQGMILNPRTRMVKMMILYNPQPTEAMTLRCVLIVCLLHLLAR